MDVNRYMDRFMELEKKHDFFSLKTSDNIYYWDIVRNPVFRLIYNTCTDAAQELNDSRHNLKMLKRGLVIIRTRIHIWLSSFFKKFNYLFLIHSRNIDDRGMEVDVVSADILRLLQDRSFVIESNKNIFPGGNKTHHYVYQFPDFITSGKNKKYAVTTVLRQYYNLDIDLDKFIDPYVRMFRKEFRFYCRLLKRIKPDAIYLVQIGLQKGLMSAGRELHIPVLEIQNCLISYSQSSYSYNHDIDYRHLKTFPDYFLTFSDFWNNKVYYPVKNSLSIGNNHLAHERCYKKENAIVFVLAFVHQKNMIDLLNDFLTLENSLIIYVKLHSSQIAYVDYIRDLFSNRENVRVVFNEISMRDLIRRSLAIVLIESTAAYEALQGGLNVFIYRRQNYLIHEDVFTNPNVYLINEASEIIDNYANVISPEGVVRFIDEFDDEKFLGLNASISAN
jgi:hypothetical protein